MTNTIGGGSSLPVDMPTGNDDSQPSKGASRQSAACGSGKHPMFDKFPPARPGQSNDSSGSSGLFQIKPKPLAERRNQPAAPPKLVIQEDWHNQPAAFHDSPPLMGAEDAERSPASAHDVSLGQPRLSPRSPNRNPNSGKKNEGWDVLFAQAALEARGVDLSTVLNADTPEEGPSKKE